MGEMINIMDSITPSARLYSLDALRGLDMLMIMGVDEIFGSLAKASGSPFFGSIAEQFTHPAWNGFHLYDLIFPLFLFLAGVATPYSVGRQMEKGVEKYKLTIRVVKRGLILVLLGIIYNNGLQIHPISEIRFGSVLGRIGLAYMFANIIYIFSKQRAQIVWFCLLLIGYWLLLKFNSAPGFAMGDLTMQGNFTSYFDRLFMPGKLYEGIHDPEGFLATIPAIGTALLGIFAGNLLKNNPMNQKRKVLFLIVAGIISLMIALSWNLVFPINKNLWTSSFVLCCGGISLILLAIFYYIIDVLGHKKWAFFLKVIGMNSILIYMSGHFINWAYSTDFFFHWLGQLIGDPYNAVVLGICTVLVQWVFLYFMYRKKVFLRV
jgi:predicted acyltransferase